ncbi:hypothetical protein GALMADRAFT_253964 [Galerina marginata CBS 339.88]|uniref:F-box domain-containing protein n=1 Tax=Galerina marginata (strain CBS 339.88) TaxID=685588 RepID=A0A067SXW7_GALM3|nr:hypothetical protein GALMADRAFT_253964 [Galerina marginata CBS 339.88]
MSATANPPSWIDTVFQLGVKRSALLQQLILLDRQHNEVIPIGQLPAEVLSLIFHYLINRDWSTTWNVQRSVQYRRSESELEFVVTASHICHRWREIALQDPTLWTLWSTFEFRSNLWLQKVKERTQSSLLTFRIALYLKPSGIAALKTHASCIRTLEVGLDDTITTITHLDNPLPHLESLSIFSFAPPSSSYRRQSWSSDSLLPETTFSGNAPCLSTVSIISVLVDLRLPIFVNVVNLSISDIRLDLEDLARHFTEGLKAMRRLESLTLSHSVLGEVTHTIPLPELRQLKIKGRLHPFSKLLTKLRTTPTCSIHLTFSIKSDDPVGAELMGEYIARTTEDYPIDLAETRWAITLNHKSLEIGYRMNQLEGPRFFLMLQRSRHSKPTLPLHIAIPTLLAPLLSRIPSYELCQNSDMHKKSVLMASEIVELLFEQRTVTSIGFNGAIAFFEAVPHLVRHAQSGGRTFNVYLPSLRTVQLKNIPMNTPEAKEKTVHVLKLRAEGGSPIQVVDLVSCDGAMLMAKSLREEFKDLDVGVRNS